MSSEEVRRLRVAAANVLEGDGLRVSPEGLLEWVVEVNNALTGLLADDDDEMEELV